MRNLKKVVSWLKSEVYPEEFFEYLKHKRGKQNGLLRVIGHSGFHFSKKTYPDDAPIDLEVYGAWEEFLAKSLAKK